MQPPIHVTGSANADWVILIGSVLVCLYWLRALRLAREGARRFLANLLLAILLFVACRAVLMAMKVSEQGTVLIPLFIALAVFSRKARVRRSRHIPKSIKRAVIARDLKGKEYDPSTHHIDHVWPFSQGGSSTADNLRVIPKEKNLKKGAKRPRMWEMW